MDFSPETMNEAGGYLDRRLFRPAWSDIRLDRMKRNVSTLTTSHHLLRRISPPTTPDLTTYYAGIARAAEERATTGPTVGRSSACTAPCLARRRRRPDRHQIARSG